MAFGHKCHVLIRYDSAWNRRDSNSLPDREHILLLHSHGRDLLGAVIPDRSGIGQCQSGSGSSAHTPGGTASTRAATPTSLMYYCYGVTDSSTGGPTGSATSVTSRVAVCRQLVASAITPSSPSIDNGQSVVLTAKPSGGV